MNKPKGIAQPDITRIRVLNNAILKYCNLFVFGIPLYFLSPLIIDIILVQFIAIGLLLLFTFNIFQKSSTLRRDDYQNVKQDFTQSLLQSNIFLSIALIFMNIYYLFSFNIPSFWYLLPVETFSIQTIIQSFEFTYRLFLDDCFSIIFSHFIFFFGLIVIVNMILNFKTYRALCRFHLGFVSNDINRNQLLGSFKKLYFYLGLTHIALNIMLSRELLFFDPNGVPYVSYSDFCGVLVFLFLFFWQLRKISMMMNIIRLRPSYRPIINQKMFKFETDITVSEKAFVFNPCFKGGYMKESKGISPIIGASFILPFIIITILWILYLIEFDPDYIYENYFDYVWSILAIVIMMFFEITFLFPILLSMNYFKIERTPSEIVFQKGFRQDRIPLDQIYQVVLDYSVIKSKVRILIVLFIPNHAIGIVKKIKMASIIPNQSFLESQLVKIMTKTLYLLGYESNQ